MLVAGSDVTVSDNRYFVAADCPVPRAPSLDPNTGLYAEVLVAGNEGSPPSMTMWCERFTQKDTTHGIEIAQYRGTGWPICMARVNSTFYAYSRPYPALHAWGRREAVAELEGSPSKLHGTITLPGGYVVQLLDSWVAARDGRDWPTPPTAPPSPPRNAALFEGAQTFDSWIAGRDGRDWQAPQSRYPLSPSLSTVTRFGVSNGPWSRNTGKAKEPRRPSLEYAPDQSRAKVRRGAGQKRQRSPGHGREDARPAKPANPNVDYSESRRDARTDGGDVFEWSTTTPQRKGAIPGRRDSDRRQGESR